MVAHRSICFVKTKSKYFYNLPSASLKSCLGFYVDSRIGICEVFATPSFLGLLRLQKNQKRGVSFLLPRRVLEIASNAMHL